MGALSFLGGAGLAHVPHDKCNQIAVSPDFAQDGIAFCYLELIDQDQFARSTDGGRNWTLRLLPMAQHGIVAFAFSPDFAADGTAFCATGNGVYRSLDRGLSWQPVNAGLTRFSCTGVAVSPDFANDHTLLLSTDGGAFRSTDGGDFWQPANVGLTETQLSVVAFGPLSAGTPSVFIGGDRVHRSDDLGQTWLAAGNFGSGIASLAVSPTFATDGIVVAALNTSGVQVSANGGLTFQPMLDGLTDMISAQVAFTATGELFLATANGIWNAAGPFLPWSLTVAGLGEPSPSTLRHYSSLAPSPDYETDATVLLAAFEGCFVTTTGAALWKQVNIYHQQLVESLAVSPGFAEDRLVLATSPGAGVLAWTVADALPVTAGRSSSATSAPVGPGAIAPAPAPGLGPGPGPTLTPVPGAKGLASSATDLSSLWPSAMALSPNFANDGVAFYGYLGLFRSEDRGAAWSKLSLPFSQPIVRSVDVSPTFANDQTLFIGTDGQGVFRSNNAGDSWADVSAGLPMTMKTRRVRVSPAYASDQTVFVASWKSGIWRSLAGGSGWANVSTGIDARIQAFVISPDFASDGMLLASGKPGRLWRTFDGGDSWATADVGLPFEDGMVVLDVSFSPDFAADRTLAASTGDGAVWLSTDGADSWQLVTRFVSGSVRSLAFSPDLANDGLLLAAAPPQLRVLRPFAWSRGGALGDPGLAAPVLRRGEGVSFEVQRSPGWEELETPGSFGGSTSRSTLTGAWRELTFYGDSITCYAQEGPNAPVVDLTLDGVPELSVDLYSAIVQGQTPFYTAQFPGSGWHTLRVTHSGQANPQSAGLDLRLDGFATTR